MLDTAFCQAYGKSHAKHHQKNKNAPPAEMRAGRFCVWKRRDGATARRRDYGRLCARPSRARPWRAGDQHGRLDDDAVRAVLERIADRELIGMVAAQTSASAWPHVRSTRLTNAFSKKLENHAATVPPWRSLPASLLGPRRIGGGDSG
jgi:hypothetical protein